MRILDRLPVPQADTLAFVGAESIRIKQYQVVVWVSVTAVADGEWRPTIPRFPAILDTGHTHNFSIQQQHLARWAGVDQGVLRQVGSIRHEGIRTPLVAARLWLDRNVRGQAAVAADAPFPLHVVRGIAIHSVAAIFHVCRSWVCEPSSAAACTSPSTANVSPSPCARRTGARGFLRGWRSSAASVLR